MGVVAYRFLYGDGTTGYILFAGLGIEIPKNCSHSGLENEKCGFSFLASKRPKGEEPP
jgi:hypothetical protein